MSSESSEDNLLNQDDEPTRKLQRSRLKPVLNQFKNEGIKIKQFLNRFKSEIVLSVLALTLAGGQYLQSINSMSNDSARIWKDGYTNKVRNRVTKFVSLNKSWINADPEEATNSLRIFTDPDLGLNGKAIYENANLMKLLAADLAEKLPDLKAGERRELTDKEIIVIGEVALSYRGSIIECLNTMEAVKTVIQTRPWWFNLISRDYLGERYNGLTKELTQGVNGSPGLRPFIDQYRFSHPRETPVWAILTEHYWDRGWMVFLCVVVLGTVFWLIYRRQVHLPPSCDNE